MQIRTYTHIWSQSRVFYTFMDWTLPKPIPVNTAVIFLLTALVWAPLVHLIASPPMTSPYTWVAYASVPAIAAYFGSRPVFEEKTLFQYVTSQVSYFMQPKALADMSPDEDDNGVEKAVSTRVWNPQWKRSKR